MKLRAWIAIALLATLLQACGGGGGGGSGSVRLVNVSDDFASLDMYVSNGTTETLLSSGVTTDGAGTYAGLGAAAYTFNLKRTGSGTTSGTSSRSVIKDTSHTLVAYSTSSALKSVFLTDNEVAPSAGDAKLRVFNGSDETGTVDIYVIDPTATLANSTPNFSGLGAERISSYLEIGAGTYHIVVTGPGDTSDIRLDLPTVTLTDQQILTFVLTSTPGGVLVNAHFVDQSKTVTGQRNTFARVRLVAAAAGTGTVAATVNNTVLSAGQNSPVINNYKLVPVGTGALTIAATLNGAAAAANSTTTPVPATLTAGTDNTLLVTGSGTSGVYTLINDDNRPPLVSTKTKLRLVHAVGNLASPVTLAADFVAVATDVQTNSASTPTNVTSTATSTTTELDVTSPGLANTITRNVVLQVGGVYTVFVIGDAAAPTVTLRRDR